MANRSPAYREQQRRYRNSEKYRQTRAAWRARTREKQRNYVRLHRLRHPFKRWEQEVHAKYGIDRAQFDSMICGQQGRCLICSKTLMGFREPHVDHDHATGEVRGLLCFNCNVLLGAARDNPETLRAAAQYLESHK